METRKLKSKIALLEEEADTKDRDNQYKLRKFNNAMADMKEENQSLTDKVAKLTAAKDKLE